MLRFLIFLTALSGLSAVIYDAYSGKPATKKQIELFNERNNSGYCTVNVKPCNASDWRRVDGSCNNLKYPSRGSPPTPTLRLVTPEFSVEYEPRTSKSGKPLPLERNVRCEILAEGRAHDLDTTMLVSYYALFAVDDVNSIHDILNYLDNTTNCCTPEGKSNYACTPSKIPVLDQVHRYSGVRCQNLTRPQSFQYFGCIDFGNTTYTRIVFVTPLFDLSNIYSYVPDSINHLRSFSKGLLKIDSTVYQKNGKIFPPGDHSEEYNRKMCQLNDYPKETLCMQYNPNAAVGPNLLLVMFYRQHNYIAKVLHKMNPCWDDERLFNTAKDINMAIQVQIYIYELLPVLLGKNNMVRDGIISFSSGGFRDVYNSTIQPLMSDEFVYLHRWFHTMQETKMKYYDANGVFLKTFPMVNLTARYGYLSNDDNMAEILGGSFRQLSAKYDDYTIDFDMAERVLGGMNFASDVATNDLIKGRYFGMARYIKYREFCSKKKYKSFSDLRDVMTEERIHRLRDIYEHVEDIDLMAGVVAENLIPGGRVPYTFYCVFIEQLKRSISSDRHWFERPNRPHAFTKKQREAIGKVTIAGVICTHGDSISRIQPNAFYTIHRERNPLVECTSPKIGKLNLFPWKDTTCSSSSYSN